MSEISFSETADDATLTEEIAGRYHSEVRITKKQKKCVKKVLTKQRYRSSFEKSKKHVLQVLKSYFIHFEIPTSDSLSLIIMKIRVLLFLRSCQ